MKYPTLTLLVLTLTLLCPPARGEDSDTKQNRPVLGDQALCNVCKVHGGETEKETVVAIAEHEDMAYGFCSQGCRDKFVEDPEGYLPPVLPRPAPSFEVLNLEGETVTSSFMDGKLVLLDFWATWCPPCLDDLPKLTKLQKRYADKGLVVAGLSIDEGDGAVKKIKRMVKRRKAEHLIYHDAKDAPAWAAYKVRSVPAQFLIDGEGNIVAQWLGKTDLEDVEAKILELLDTSE